MRFRVIARKGKWKQDKNFNDEKRARDTAKKLEADGFQVKLLRIRG